MIRENNNAQRRSKPNLVPAIEHIVIVPGPINAAATTEPGPIFLKEIKAYYS